MTTNEVKLTSAEFERFLRDNPHGTWEDGIRRFFGGKSLLASRAVDDTIRKELARELTRSKLRWQHIYDWLLLGAALSQGELLADYTLMRALTPSSIAREYLKRLVGLYLQLAQSAAPWISTAVLKRLKSYAAFTELFIDALSHRQNFENVIRAAPPDLVRSVIILTEHQFAGLEPKRALIPNSPFSYHRADTSLEDFATGASYILTAFNRLVGITPKHTPPFRRSSVSPNTFEPLIMAALKLFSLDEAEVDVFRAGHSCEKNDTHNWSIEPPTEATGRAFALGNVETTMQEIIRHQELNQELKNEQAVHFKEFAAYWLDYAGGELFVFADSPIRRLRLEFPDVHARILGREILLKEQVFAEEIELLSGTSYELVTEVDHLRTFKITDALTLWDVLIISRIFRLLAHGWIRALRQERNRDHISFINSSLALVPLKDTYALLTAFEVEEAKARDYVDLFSWDVRQRKSYADLQYRPFIHIEGHILIPLSLHVSSNLFRNVLLTKQLRLSSGTQPDLVTAKLYEVIAAAHTDVAKDVKFRFKGEESDLDVVFRLGSTLFVFECKNTLRPSSSFEMRTTLDQLDKAALQLNRARRLWNDIEFRRLLERKLGFRLDGVTHLETAVVLSHRLFSGARHCGIPVRHLRSLGQFIHAGELTLSLGEQQHVSRFWSSAQLSDTDLTAFLSDNSPLYAPCWQAQQREEVRLQYGKAILVRPRYPLNMHRLMEELGVSESFRAEYDAQAQNLIRRYGQKERGKFDPA